MRRYVQERRKMERILWTCVIAAVLAIAWIARWQTELADFDEWTAPGCRRAQGWAESGRRSGVCPPLLQHRHQILVPTGEREGAYVSRITCLAHHI